MKKRRRAKGKSGRFPEKTPAPDVEKAMKKTSPCTGHQFPDTLLETPVAPDMAFAPSDAAPSGQKKRRPSARRKIVLPNEKGGLAPPLKASLS